VEFDVFTCASQLMFKQIANATNGIISFIFNIYWELLI